MWSAMSAHEPRPYVSAPSRRSSSSSAPQSSVKIGIECCSMTWKECVRGSWSRDDLPSLKHGTQRSYSWQTRLAHLIRTCSRLREIPEQSRTVRKLSAHRGGNVNGANVAYVFDAALRSSDCCLLLDNAHGAFCHGLFAAHRISCDNEDRSPVSDVTYHENTVPGM